MSVENEMWGCMVPILLNFSGQELRLDMKDSHRADEKMFFP